MTHFLQHGREMTDVGELFSQLLVKHDRAILRYIMTFIPRRDDAEDVLQRTASAVWKRFPEYDSSREFLPWAIHLAYFEVLNYRKEIARGRLVFHEDLLHALAETHEACAPLLDAQIDALQECLKHLGPEEAALLRQRYCDSEPVASLARQEGITIKSIYRKLDRLRDRVAQCMQRRLAGESAWT